MSPIPRLSEQSSWARWGRGARYINLSRALPIGRAFFGTVATLKCINRKTTEGTTQQHTNTPCPCEHIVQSTLAVSVFMGSQCKLHIYRKANTLKNPVFGLGPDKDGLQLQVFGYFSLQNMQLCGFV